MVERVACPRFGCDLRADDCARRFRVGRKVGCEDCACGRAQAAIYPDEPVPARGSRRTTTATAAADAPPRVTDPIPEDDGSPGVDSGMGLVEPQRNSGPCGPRPVPDNDCDGTLGQAMLAWRAARGLSQIRAAEAVGISQTNWSRGERGNPLHGGSDVEARVRAIVSAPVPETPCATGRAYAPVCDRCGKQVRWINRAGDDPLRGYCYACVAEARRACKWPRYMGRPGVRARLAAWLRTGVDPGPEKGAQANEAPPEEARAVDHGAPSRTQHWAAAVLASMLGPAPAPTVVEVVLPAEVAALLDELIATRQPGATRAQVIEQIVCEAVRDARLDAGRALAS